MFSAGTVQKEKEFPSKENVMTPYEKAFSNNIRRFRKRMHMTQKMLADAAGYSEKTVSKWETEGALPSIESLFRISSILHVELTTLFQDNETMYYLGIDGGGTKTNFTLVDYTGEAIRHLILEGCNPVDIGIDKTIKILANGIHQTCEGLPLASVVVFAGIAGCSSGDYANVIEAYLSKLSFAAYAVGSDNENIIATGLGNRDGITVILGTGICSFVVQNHQYHRISGWGYLFDEGGSAYNIGRDAISHYYSAYDESGEQTSLVPRIEEKAGCAGADLLKLLYNGGKQLIASYAPLVFEEAQKGDSVSQLILEKNIAEISRIIRAGVARFPDDKKKIPVVLAGGLTNEPCLLPALLDALGDTTVRCDLQILAVEPVVGAIQRAKDLWKKVVEYEHE